MDIKVSDIVAIIKGLNTMVPISSMKSDTLFEDAGMDSLDRMNLFLEIEEQFSLKIPDTDFNELNSIDAIIQYLKRIS